MLDDQWKLQIDDKPNKTWLFNLRDDPTEHHDLAESNPRQVRELMKVLDQIDGQQARPLWPSLLEGPIDIDHPLSYPESSSDDYVFWSN